MDVTGVALLFYLLLTICMALSGLYPQKAADLLQRVYRVFGFSIRFTPRSLRVLQVLSFFFLIPFFLVTLLLALMRDWS